MTKNSPAENTEKNSGIRTFKVKLASENDSEYRGRFTGKNPQQAAKKALTTLLGEQNKKTGQYKFIIKESTRGSKKREYAYNGTKTKRSEPNEVFFPGQDKPILYKYDTSVHSDKKLAKSLIILSVAHIIYDVSKYSSGTSNASNAIINILSLYLNNSSNSYRKSFSLYCGQFNKFLISSSNSGLS